MKIRLYVKDNIVNQDVIALSDEQAHYLTNVMRVKEGETIFIFNGIDGEWEAEALFPMKKKACAKVIKKVKEAEKPSNVWLMFAPVKKDCLNFIVEKATELEAEVIFPVITQRTENTRVNTNRMLANAIEASEQCRRVSIPEISEPESLKKVINNWNDNRILFFLDETGNGEPIVATLKKYKSKGTPVAFVVGPEGGFAPEELAMMREMKNAVGITFDNHILRTETACVAALAIWKYL